MMLQSKEMTLLPTLLWYRLHLSEITNNRYLPITDRVWPEIRLKSKARYWCFCSLIIHTKCGLATVMFWHGTVILVFIIKYCAYAFISQKSSVLNHLLVIKVTRSSVNRCRYYGFVHANTLTNTFYPIILEASIYIFFNYQITAWLHNEIRFGQIKLECNFIWENIIWWG